MVIHFVTSNKGKFEWACRRLSNSEIQLKQKELRIEESRDIDVEDVVRFKAKMAEKHIKNPFIIEDSGFCITALNNFPATHIKLVMNTIGTKGLLKLMKRIKNRKVMFKSALIFSNNGQKKVFVCNDVGTLANSEKGNNLHGFNDLMKIFIPKGFKKTLAEMSDSEFGTYEKGIEKVDHYYQFLNWFSNNHESIRN
jgi:non-canonical purine NTP pyrophosphatase (RdgB/HAM1 family)